MRVLAYFVLLFVAAGIALLKGTKVERSLAWVLVAGNLATLGIVHVGSIGSYSSLSDLYFLIDLLVMVAFCWIAVQWPAWVSILIASFQLNGTLGHLVKFAAPTIFDISYALMLKFWGWAMLVVLLISRSRPNMRRMLSGKHWPSFSVIENGASVSEPWR